MSVQPTVEFWFEFASSYSHLAAWRVESLAHTAGVDVAWRPFLLGPIFREHGWDDSPFNLYPARGRYMWRDVERRCKARGLAFRRPSVFPRNGLLAARVALVASDEPWCGDFIRGVFRANFAEDRDIADTGVVGSVLEASGQPAAAWLERAARPESKRALREQTENAAKHGIFGSPSVRVGEELFWGDDRLQDAFVWARRGSL